MLDMLDDAIPTMLAAGTILAVWGKIWPYLLMFAGFSVIIFIHELGHFMVAKWAGVKVDRFAIGFGREVLGFTRGETRYSFNILPLGGYVKMLGQEDFDDKSEELRFKDDARSFINKPVSHRMAIVSAGVVMNMLLACLLFMIVFMVGKKSMSTRIANVVADSPAARGGLEAGDIVLEVNGVKVLGFNELKMAIVLAPLHEPIEFVVERDGELKSFSVIPEYMMSDNTRDPRQLMVGISPGRTREIVYVRPEIDVSREDRPHVGDFIVEVSGSEITDENISTMLPALAYAGGDIYVERKDPKNPDAPPQRVRIDIPPTLALHRDLDASGTTSVLGLTPLVRFSAVNPKGRAYLAGIDVGDAVLSWDDHPYPTREKINRSVRDNPERDIHFKVQRRDGRIVEGFVRPKRHQRGRATIQAVCESVDNEPSTPEGPQARFAEVRPGGIAEQAGIKAGDLVVSCGGKTHPTAFEVNNVIRGSTAGPIQLSLRKENGDSVTTQVVPMAPGAIDAGMNLIADDILRIAEVVESIDDRPSPAAKAGLTAGILITAINGQPVKHWKALIDLFRRNAGSTVKVAYRDTQNQLRSTELDVPHSLRTLLGIGPEGKILSIDGKRKVMLELPGGPQLVTAGYLAGTPALLSQLVGRSDVEVQYRINPLAPVQTERVAVTEEMVHPWLAHVEYLASVEVGPEIIPLKAENALEAVEIGFRKTYYFILQVYTMLDRMIFTRSVGLDNMAGPLGIIDIGGQAARASFVDFLFFMAIISANLAVLNFLPLPIVDGGLMVFLIIEKIKGTPVSLRVQIATQMIGLFLILGAFLFVTFNDAMRLWG